MTGMPEDLYETDYYRWVRAQVAELRRMRRDRVNTALDLERLADEVNDLGKSERDACRSAVRIILEHCLKLAHSPATMPQAGWRISIRNARATLDDKLTPSLRRDLARALPSLYDVARANAEDAMREHGEREAVAALPASCPYTLDDLVARDWFPTGPDPEPHS
jgi:hypothetical protein